MTINEEESGKPATTSQRKNPGQEVIMIGPFPPPIQGAAVMNAAVRDLLIRSRTTPAVINLSPKTLDRRWGSRLSRASRIITGLFRYAGLLWNSRGGSMVYMSLSGGWGQVYELPFIVLCRVFRSRLVLHHHSFAYIDKPRMLTHMLLRCGGPGTLNLALCKGMAHGLRSAYKPVANVFVLSNVAILEHSAGDVSGAKEAVKTIGFLGNISYEKGILEFLDVAARLEATGQEVAAWIAGPFETPEVESAVRKRMAELKSATYLGARYGPEKKAFYEHIDTLLFPSKYVNEAEPVTVYEAMMAGVPVIAWDRGCLSGMVTESTGGLVSRNDDFVAMAFARIQSWIAAPADFREASQATLKAWESLNRGNAGNLSMLLGILNRTGLPQPERKQ